MVLEDFICNVYVVMFMMDELVCYFVKEYQLDEDVVVKLLVVLCGNYEIICDFMVCFCLDKLKKGGIDLFQQIFVKDFCDVSFEVLIDYMMNLYLCVNVDYFCRFVCNLCVSNEMIILYKGFFEKVVFEQECEVYFVDLMKLVVWVVENICVDKDCNLGGFLIILEGVWKVCIVDVYSCDIFFVFMVCSMGIFVCIDEVIGKVQLMGDEGVVDVNFEVMEQVSVFIGKFIVRYMLIKFLVDLKYYFYFFIFRLIFVGILKLLNYDEGDIDMGGGVIWVNLLKNGMVLDVGNYVMVIGICLVNGGVLFQLIFFIIKLGEMIMVDLVMCESKDDIQVIGNFNLEFIYKLIDSDELKFIFVIIGCGYYIVVVLGVG